MSQSVKLNEKITVGAQPNNSEIESLANEGYKTIINFRTAGEEDQPLSPDAEGEEVETADMKYLHVPVSMNSMDQEKVDALRDQLETLPKPIFAHCKTGKRAGAMMMMHVAVEQNMSGEQTLKKAEDMGFECDVPQLREFVKSYVDDRTNS